MTFCYFCFVFFPRLNIGLSTLSYCLGATCLPYTPYFIFVIHTKKSPIAVVESASFLFLILPSLLVLFFPRSSAPFGANIRTKRRRKETKSNIFPAPLCLRPSSLPVPLRIYGLSIEIPFRVTEICCSLSFIICVLPTILIKLHAHPECRLSSDAASCE